MLMLTLIVGAVVGIVWYLYHRLTYWQRKGVPTPGLTYQWHYYKKELPLYDMDLNKKYGSVYGVMEALKPILIVGEPDLIRDILIKDFSSFPNHKPFRTGDQTTDLNLFSLEGNEDWKRIRSLLSPTFTSGKLRSMEPLINACIASFKKNLVVVAESGEVIDAKVYFNALSFDVIAQCAYGTKIDSLSNPNSPIQKNFQNLIGGSFSLVFTVLFPKIAALTGIKERAMRPFQFFDKMTLALIEERKKVLEAKDDGNRLVFNDFLQTMIDATREAAAAEEESVGASKTLSMNEMIAQTMIFLLAGFDTTATIMAASAYHLAKNPTVQEKLIAEVLTLQEYTHDSVMGLKYLEAFIKECFRMTPPVNRVERECVASTLLGNVKVEPGTIVSIPVFTIHRDPIQYKNPEQFNPDRFLNGGDSVNHHPNAFLPFGGGPRMCVAQRFALLEVKLAMTQVLKEFHFEATPDTKMSYLPASFDALVPRPIMVRVKKH